MKQFFDARRVVNGELTLAEGAIRGWDRRNVYYFQMLGSLAQHYGFSLEEPFDELGAEHQKVVLYGSGREKRRLPLSQRPRRHRQAFAPLRRHPAEP